MATGKVAWSHDTASDGRAASFHGDLLVTDDLVVVPADTQPEGSLYGFERATGKLRWRQPFPGGIATDLRRHGDAVIGVTVGGTVVAVEIATGVLRWSVDDPPGEADWPPLDPALAEGVVYVARHAGAVDALDAATGKRLWRRELPSRLNTSAVLFGGELVVGSTDGRLYRLEPRSGEVLGSFAAGGPLYGDLVDAGGCLLALWSGPHTLGCLEPGLSGLRWQVDAPDEWGSFHPLVARSQVVVGRRGRVLAVGLADGAPLWEIEVTGLPRGLGASGDLLFVGTLAGKVLAYPWPAAVAAPD